MGRFIPEGCYFGNLCLFTRRFASRCHFRRRRGPRSGIFLLRNNCFFDGLLRRFCNLGSGLGWACLSTGLDRRCGCRRQSRGLCWRRDRIRFCFQNFVLGFLTCRCTGPSSSHRDDRNSRSYRSSVSRRRAAELVKCEISGHDRCCKPRGHRRCRSAWCI